MKRFNAIWMLVVLIGWLIMPAAIGKLGHCSMHCCRRQANFSQVHFHCGGTDSEDQSNLPTISSISLACPVGCALKAYGNPPVLPSRAIASIPAFSCAIKNLRFAREDAGPKLFNYAGRAPPVTA